MRWMNSWRRHWPIGCMAAAMRSRISTELAAKKVLRGRDWILAKSFLRGSAQEDGRIDRATVDTDLIMKMRAGRPARAADLADDGSFADDVTFLHEDLLMCP